MKRRFLCAVPQAAAVTMLLAALTAPPALAVEPVRENGSQNRVSGAKSRARAPIELVLTSVPKRALAKSNVAIAGYVRNQSGQQPSGVSVRLRYRATPLGSRGELDQFARTSAPQLPGFGPVVDFAAPLPSGDTPWRLKTTAPKLGMNRFGVYPIAIEVFNRFTGALIAARTTTLVYVGGKLSVRPTKVAWVWPMVDRPHRAGDATFLDDELETSMGSGRLAGLVAAANKTSRVPLTWAVDPALLDDARAMAGGYTLRTTKGGKTTRTRRPASTAAQRWLADLRGVSGDDPYFTVPYADPDPVALVGNGMRKHLGVAYKHMDMTAGEDLLGRPAKLNIAWPPAGAADQDTLDQMSRLNSQAFLMNGQVLPSPNQTVTPNATTTLETSAGLRRAVGYDATLNKVISGSTRNPADALLAEQRFLAETAMITAEQPSNARTLVIAPDRRWNPGTGFAERLLTYTAGAKWLKPVSLESVIKAAPEQRTFTGFPATETNRNLSARYLKKVREISGKASRFSTIFEPPTNSYERMVLRTESSYWRGHPANAFRRREIIGSELDRDIARIRIVSNRRTGLAGSSGSMPVTIANDLAVGKVTVRLQVVSKTPARLRIGSPNPAVVTLGPNGKETLVVPLQAYANGNTDVVMKLLTPDGREFGESKVINVRTTGYGRTALLITGGGLAVLFLGVGLRVLRAKRRSRAEGTRDGESAGEGPSPDDAAEAATAEAATAEDTAVGATAAGSASGGIDGTGRAGRIFGADGADRADGANQADDRADSPVPSTSGTDSGNTGSPGSTPP